MEVKNVVCIIPVYNEGDKILETLEGLKTIKEIDEIILVDDGSTDRTIDIINKTEHTVFSSEKNMGKGHSIKLALKEINHDYVLLLDGDLGESSIEAKKLLEPILKNRGDFSIAKFPEAKKNTDSKGGVGLVKGLARSGIKFFTGKTMTTSLSGQRVYKKEILDKIDYIPNRYGIEVAMTIQSLNEGYELIEVPVEMDHRYTGRDIQGFIHRGKQFKDILTTFIIMFFKGYKR